MWHKERRVNTHRHTVWETEDWGEVMFLTLHVILANLSHNFVAQFDYLYLNLFSFISEIL